MTLRELLNSQLDFASIAAAARRGFSWWLDELAAMLPPAWRARLSSGPRTWAEAAEGGAWRFWKDERLLGGDRPPAGTRIGLMLPAREVLVREVPAPRMPAADVRRMLAMDIDRLSPLSPALIHFDMEIIDRDAGGGQRVLLGVVPRAVAASLVAEARAGGLRPVRLAARIDDSGPGRRFDFLPAVVATEGDAGGGVARKYAWAVVAALLIVNLGVLIGRDMAAVDHLRGFVDRQRPMVTAIQALRRRVEAEDARRRDILARAGQAEPLRMLNVLTQALPTDTFVQRLEWNGQTLHIVGSKGPDTDLAAAIRGSGAFTNPRFLGPESATGSARGRPFDVTADARPVARP